MTTHEFTGATIAEARQKAEDAGMYDWAWYHAAITIKDGVVTLRVSVGDEVCDD
jgi:hypothetical protein